MIRYKRSTRRSVAEKFQPSRRRISESRRASRLFNRRRLNENEAKVAFAGNGKDSWYEDDPVKPNVPNGEYWEVVTLDVWGNEEDGYEVNDSFKTNEFYLISPDATDDEILNVLKNDGWFINRGHSATTLNDLQIDSSDYSLYIERVSDGKPLLMLQKDF